MNITPLTFAVDLDDTVCRYTDTLVEYAARANQIDPSTLPAKTCWSFADAWPALFPTDADFIATHVAAVNDGLYDNLAPYDGARDALWRLSDAGIAINIVTARLVTNRMHAQVAASTVAWLDAHDLPYRGISFVQRDKTHVRADLAIDDAPHNVTGWRAVGVPTIVFDQPYNRHVPGPRAHTWADVAELVLAAQAQT